jgi:hypothetical protein
VTADSSSTARLNFDSPSRRSTNVIGTSAKRRRAAAAAYSISTRNEYPPDEKWAIGIEASASRRQQR